MKKIVITGPTGAVGMALLKKCLQEGDEVLAVCHPNSKRIANISKNSRLKIVEKELSAIGEVAKGITESYDVFYHFAWAGTTGEARNDTQLQCENIESTIAAVELASRLGCGTFIGAGSQAEYGRVEGLLQALTPTFPENGYGMAKLCAGQLSRLKCEQLGMRHIWTRILSVYGPYDGENTMIIATLKKLLSGEHASFTPGEQHWDYLYSADAAQAMYLLGDFGKDKKTYVIGSGQMRMLKEYIAQIEECVRQTEGKCGSIGIGDYPYADRQVMCLGADISDLVRDTGFEPTISFAEGIRRTLVYVKNMV